EGGRAGRHGSVLGGGNPPKPRPDDHDARTCLHGGNRGHDLSRPVHALSCAVRACSQMPITMLASIKSARLMAISNFGSAAVAASRAAAIGPPCESGASRNRRLDIREGVHGSILG